MKIKLNADRILCTLAVGYIVLPICLFLVGWTKLYIAVAGCILLIYLAIRLLTDLNETEISITSNGKFWVTALAFIAIWALFSGIGGGAYQTDDFKLRNAVFRDLCTYNYPVIYDMQKEPEPVQAFLGNVSSGMCVYYFTWWLPAACVARFLYYFNVSSSIAYGVASISLYLWAVLGLFLTFYCLVRFFNKYSFWILSAFMLFSGLDFIAYLLQNMQIPVNTHIEWIDGAKIFQYSSHTTQLYWVFNQSIPIWLILAVLLLLTKNKRMGAWSSLAFAYSPFATIGLIPICFVAMLNDKGKQWKEKIKSAISFENIAVVIMMLVIFGSFYMLVMGKIKTQNGFIFSVYPQFKTLTCYLFFILFEVLFYFTLMGADARHYKFYWIVLAELILIPLYKMGQWNDFCMRGSIAPLFLFMVLCVQYLFDKNPPEKRKKIFAICLVIGFLTSFTEIQRNVSCTLSMSEDKYICDTIYSLGSMQLQDPYSIQLHLDQYIALDNVYKDSFFYTYISDK